jgi:hypothetical protein
VVGFVEEVDAIIIVDDSVAGKLTLPKQLLLPLESLL